jgi:hypothetical protein
VSRRPWSRRAPREVLERRYRWLLAVYPASYRTANAEEIVGVGMSRASDAQRWPGLGEALSLVRGGLGVRVRGLVAWTRQPAWGTAGAAFTAIGAVLLATISAERFTSALASYFPDQLGLSGLSLPGFAPSHLGPSGPVLAAGWLLAAVAVMAGWRRVGAGAAGLAAAGEIAWLVAGYPGGPWVLVTSWWLLILTVTVLVAAIVAWAAPGGRAAAPLGRWAMAALVAVAALMVAAPGISAAVTTVTPQGQYGVATVSNPLDGASGLLRDGLVVLLAAAVIAAMAGLAQAVRRRVLVLALPVAAAAGVSHYGFGGFLAASPRFVPPVLLTWPQWAALVIVPLVATGTGAVWLTRHERLLQRAAEHPEAAS